MNLITEQSYLESNGKSSGKLAGLRAAFHTLGCRVNAYETEAMRESLKKEGCEIVDFAPGADLYIINTCTVTNIADRKSRQMLHRAKEMNPDAVVAAVGCYAEDGRAILSADPAADLVIGNREKADLAGYIRNYLDGRAVSSGENDQYPAKDFDGMSVTMHEGRTRAYIKAEDGCSQFCTYCIIPYVRGRVRSRAPGSILKEAERLSEGGYREVVLTGIHLSSYGTDFDGISYNAMAGRTNTRLLSLLEEIGRIPGIDRIRLGSLEPGLITEEFAAGLAGIREICPQFHLSLQSGCDETLVRMNRRYTTGDYAAIAERLRTHFKDPALTTDIITGFPGETDDEFRKTKEFVRGIHFAKTHIFPYSRREGTKAASMPGQVSGAVKKERSAELLELDRTERTGYSRQFVGRPVEVLFEEPKEMNGVLGITGRTREALDFFYAAAEDLSGQIRVMTAAGTDDDGVLLLS